MNTINGAEQANGRHLPASRQPVGAHHMYIKVPPDPENHSVRGSNKNRHITEETNRQWPALKAGN